VGVSVGMETTDGDTIGSVTSVTWVSELPEHPDRSRNNTISQTIYLLIFNLALLHFNNQDLFYYFFQLRLLSSIILSITQAIAISPA
jgi:hypothetical protein